VADIAASRLRSTLPRDDAIPQIPHTGSSLEALHDRLLAAVIEMERSVLAGVGKESARRSSERPS